MPSKRGNIPRPRLRPLSDSEVWAEVVANLGLAHARARHYHHPNSRLALADLVQVGVFGLYRAVELYDPESGFLFSTYATDWVDSYVRSAIAESRHLVHVPRWAAAAARRVNRGQFDLAAARAHKAACVGAALKVLGATFYSGRSTMGRDELDEIEERPEGGPPTGLSPAVVAALNSLGEREQFVLRGRFGLDGQQKLCRELGAELGITKERARQIEKEALRKLRAYLGVDIAC